MKSKPYIDSVYGYPGEFSELEYFHLLSLFFYFFFLSINHRLENFTNNYRIFPLNSVDVELSAHI